MLGNRNVATISFLRNALHLSRSTSVPDASSSPNRVSSRLPFSTSTATSGLKRKSSSATNNIHHGALNSSSSSSSLSAQSHQTGERALQKSRQPREGAEASDSHLQYDDPELSGMESGFVSFSSLELGEKGAAEDPNGDHDDPNIPSQTAVSISNQLEQVLMEARARHEQRKHQALQRQKQRPIAHLPAEPTHVSLLRKLWFHRTRRRIQLHWQNWETTFRTPHLVTHRIITRDGVKITVPLKPSDQKLLPNLNATQLSGLFVSALATVLSSEVQKGRSELSINSLQNGLARMMERIYSTEQWAKKEMPTDPHHHVMKSFWQMAKKMDQLRKSGLEEEEEPEPEAEDAEDEAGSIEGQQKRAVVDPRKKFAEGWWDSLATDLLNLMVLSLENPNVKPETSLGENYIKFDNGRNVLVIVSPEFFQDDSTKNFQALAEPMITKPRRWSPKSGVSPYYTSQTNLILSAQHPGIRQDVMRNTNTALPQIVVDALNALSNTKWRINTGVLELVDDMTQRGKWLSEIKQEKAPEEQRNFAVSDVKEAPYKEELVLRKLDEKRVKKEKRDRKNEEGYWRKQLSVARTYSKFGELYFPHNIDFRGRAYVISPFLQHMGSDACRGLLDFAEKVPLGSEGLFWLKVHCANVYGKDKLSFNDRVKFVDSQLPAIMKCGAGDVLAEDAWWRKGEEPIQCMAACLEIARIHTLMAQGQPAEEITSSLPVQLDGSCNGLQHFVALTRNRDGAEYVNMMPSDRNTPPSDAYSAVLRWVKEQLETRTWGYSESELMDRLNLKDNIVRKTVKRPVMTSVYGVTPYGARKQIAEELVKAHPDWSSLDIGKASALLAKLTIEGVGVFYSLSDTQDWLKAMAKKYMVNTGEPVSWVTPLGLRIVQPYYREQRLSLLHKAFFTTPLMIAPDYEWCGLDVGKQTTAFPPNFVHSLDASHMFLTAHACKLENVTFASVHDCFWTQAGNVHKMSRILREQFVALHSLPILDRLWHTLRVTPGSPDLIEQKLAKPRGQYGLESVEKATYFFS